MMEDLDTRLRRAIAEESRYRPVTRGLIERVKSDIESGLTLREIQKRYAPYGAFTYLMPLTKRNQKFRYRFDVQGHTALFETLPQARDYLGKWQTSHQPLTKPGCLTCVYACVGEDLTCTAHGGKSVKWFHVWAMPDDCGQWSQAWTS